MATVTERATTDESADAYLKRLDVALKREQLATEVIEPSTRLKVYAPNGNPMFDEVLTMRPAADEVLTWYWSWDAPERPAPVGPAYAVADLVASIKNVLCADRA